MSLKKMAVRMAIAFAAAKGYQAYRRNGGMEGLKRTLSQSGGSSGGIGGMLSSLGAGSGGASGGLLGGLAAMAGGSQLGTPHEMTMQAEAGPDDEDTAAIMVRAIGQAVRADGQIDAEERAVLNDLIGQADTDEDRAVIDVALSEPVHPEALARDVGRGHEAEVYAASNTCPHKGGPLAEGIVHGQAVTCPLHNWVFDLNSGQAQGADEGQIATYPVQLDGDRILLDSTSLGQRSAA